MSLHAGMPQCVRACAWSWVLVCVQAWVGGCVSGAATSEVRNSFRPAGKPAPKLILKSHVESMRPGSVIVDLAAEAGGNCEYTKPGGLAVTPNGVKVLGYVDWPSRMATQASALYANNISKFLLATGPFSTGRKGEWLIDETDPVTRGALVLQRGQLRWPAPPVPLAQAPKKAAAVEKKHEGPVDLKAETMTNAQMASGAIGVALLAGMASPGPAFTSMLTKFGLASICGYQTVWGVVPALHSPLMSVTNAVSGLTAVGGMVLAGGGLLPHSGAQVMASRSLIMDDGSPIIAN